MLPLLDEPPSPHPVVTWFVRPLDAFLVGRFGSWSVRTALASPGREAEHRRICEMLRMFSMRTLCCSCVLHSILCAAIATFMVSALIQALNFSTTEMHWVRQGGTPLLLEEILGTGTGVCGDQVGNWSRIKDEHVKEVVPDRSPTERQQQIGVGLLHLLTDAELFQKAISVERTRLADGSSSPRRSKIAFLFVTQRDLPLAPFWNRFFAGHEDLYNIYVHMWPLQLNAIQKDMGAFWGRLVPSQEGKRLTPGLIAVARRLLANALLDDASNEWFAVVSDSCVPLYSFPHIYETLASTNKSLMEVTAKHWDMPNRYKARGDEAMEPEIAYWQFRMGSQFWVMRRRHALITVGDTKYWDKFNRPCLKKYVDCYPEEHYFATLLNILDPFGTTQHTATLVDWAHREVGEGHPRTFLASEINPGFIEDLRNWGKGRFLFARKFDRGCLEPLLESADAILSR